MNQRNRRTFLCSLRAAGLAALTASVWMYSSTVAHAADEPWPSRPIRFVVPFAAGGATDAMARLLAQRMAAVWKQPVIVDNKPGAGTVLGTDVVAKAAPDGATFGIVVSAHEINPSLRPKLPYDTLKDFAAVSEVGVQHMVIAAHPSFPADNLAQLIALAKKEPGKISYASSGSGTALHLGMELLKTRAGIDMLHVPYKGGAPAQQDVIGGQVPLLVDIYHSSSPFIKAGRLKAIALFSPERPKSIASIPTIAETVPGVSAVSVLGVVAPAATPAAIVAKASADMATVIRSPEFAEQLQGMGVEAVGSTPQEFDSIIRADIQKWAPVVKSSGALPD
ncbi:MULTISPECIES: tripartite tricarboxylate transporter substrate binding protein [unclassified Variovorax]|uniref:tripartite tricarboxylate transporter substrate binding protein n=1 Tax=unclassified Variovorax TaxID=663243 RepID=UPI003F468E0E